MSFRRRALFLAGLFVAVSCSDAGNPVAPRPEPTPPTPEEALASLTCTVNVAASAMSCAPDDPNLGGASGAIIGGSNGYNVNLTSANFSSPIPNDSVTGGEYAFDVTIENRIVQAMGSVDGSAPHADGIRIFFSEDPAVTVPFDPTQPRSVSVANPDGMAIFTSAPTEYFQYNQVLQHTEVSDAKRWKFTIANAKTFTFKVLVAAEVPHPKGWLEITPDGALLEVGGTTTLTATVRNVHGKADNDNVTWSSSDPAVVTVPAGPSLTAMITAAGEGTAWVKAQSNKYHPHRVDSVLVTVSNKPAVPADSINALTNVQVRISPARLRQGLLAGDSVVAGKVYDTDHGYAVVDSERGLTYVSDGGYFGPDVVNYQVTDGHWTVNRELKVNVESTNYWFVRQGATGDGSNARPLGSISAAATAGAPGDTIFVLRNGSTELVGAATLDADQALIGQGVPAGFLLKRDALNEPARADTVFQGQGLGTPLMNTGAATLTLNLNNVVRGVNITSADAAAIHGVGFGTLTVGDVFVQAGGPSLSLQNGDVAGSFLALHSSSSDSAGIRLANVGGTLAASAASITGAAGISFHVAGGGGTISFPGDITHASAARAVDVSGRTGGTLTLSGALSGGGGISVQGNTGGTIEFTGASKAVTVAGATVGVNLDNNTGAEIRFGGGGLDVDAVNGAGFSATNGGTVIVQGAGNTVATTGTGSALVLQSVSTGATGTGLTFASVTANGAAHGVRATGLTGTGGFQVQGGTIQNTTDHAVHLASLGSVPVELEAVTLSGALAAGKVALFGADADSLVVIGTTVNVTGGPALSLSDGKVYGSFATLSSQNSPSNGVVLTTMGGDFDAPAGAISGAASTAFAVTTGGSVSVDYAGSISQANANPLLAVNGSHTGTLVFSGALNASNGTGLQFTDADGTYQFLGTTTLNGGNAGVDVAGVSDGTFLFAAGTSITNPTGVALDVNGGTPGLTYLGSITHNTGRAVSVMNITADSVMVNGAISSGTAASPTGLGILVQGNTGGKIGFNGTSKALFTAANPAVTLATNTGAQVEFRGGGLAITTTTGAGIAASGGGQVSATGAGNTVFTTTGTPLSLNAVSTGTDGVTLASLTTSGAVNGVAMTGVTGAGVTVAGGGITNTTGAAIAISGGSAALVMHGNVSQAANAPVVSVSGGHTGAVTFATGTLTATAGTGLQFDNADGTYAFNGTSSMNGGDAGLDILNGSAGSFTFVAGNSITNPSGTAVRVNASAPASLSFQSAITKANAGLMIDITDQASGTISFGTGTLAASAGSGIQLSNVDGTVNFQGTTQLSGGAAVDVISGSTGSIHFSADASIVSPTGPGFHVSTGTPNVNYQGTIASNATGRPVQVESITGGTVQFSGTVSATAGGGGILAQNNTGGTVRFNGSSKTLTTGANAGVSLVTNTGTTFEFTGGNLDIVTTTGNGFSATGGGTVEVTGSSNEVTAVGGIAVNVQNTTVGANGLTFQSVNANGGANGIVLNSTGATNGLQVTGTGSAGSGGTIQNTTGAGISLTSTLNPTFTRMVVQSTGDSGVKGTGVTNFKFTNNTVTGSGTSSGANMSNIDFNGDGTSGTQNHLSGTVTIQSNTLSNAYAHGINIFNFAGTIDSLGISDNVVTTPTSGGQHGIRVIAFGTAGNVAKILRGTINNNQISNVPMGVGLQVQCANSSMSGPAAQCGTLGSATNAIRITNNTIQGQSAANRINAEGIIALVNGVGQGNFVITGNTVRYVNGTAISHSAFGNAQVTSTITGNIIEAHNINLAQGIGIGTSYTTASGAAETPVLTSTISGNTISQTNGSGILSVANDVNGTVKVKILNNNVSAPLGGTYGIQVRSGSAAGNNTVCARIESNTTAGGTTAGGTLLSGIGIRKQGTVAGTNTFGVHGLSPSPATSAAAETHVTGVNPSSATGGNGKRVSSISGSNYEGCNLP